MSLYQVFQWLKFGAVRISLVEEERIILLNCVIDNIICPSVIGSCTQLNFVCLSLSCVRLLPIFAHVNLRFMFSFLSLNRGNPPDKNVLRVTNRGRSLVCSSSVLNTTATWPQGRSLARQLSRIPGTFTDILVRRNCLVPMLVLFHYGFE